MRYVLYMYHMYQCLYIWGSMYVCVYSICICVMGVSYIYGVCVDMVEEVLYDCLVVYACMPDT